MTIFYESIPLVTLTGTTLFCAWKWQAWKASSDWLRKCHRRTIAHLNETKADRDDWRHDAIELLHELRTIKRRRHLAGKAGRAAQIAAHKAKVAETTQKLRAVS